MWQMPYLRRHYYCINCNKCMKRNLVGNTYGNLRVIGHSNNNTKCIVQCDCGVIKEIMTDSILRGNNENRSCGCVQKEMLIKRNYKHGYANRSAKKSKEYKTWAGMIERCSPSSNRYDRVFYVDKGISVCDRWASCFKFFLQDMGTAPSSKHTLDRKDNSKGYFKENCRWATVQEQNRNKGNVHFITYNGVTKCLSEWAEEYNIPYGRLSMRLHKYGWDIHKALTTPNKLSKEALLQHPKQS